MRASTFIAMSAAIALLASCAVEQDTPNIPQEKEGKTYLEVTATQPTTPATRMTYEEDDGTATGSVGLIATWSPNERLAVASYSGEVGATTLNALSADDYLTGGDEAAASTTFKGEIGKASTGAMAGRYNFYYPAPAASAISGNTVTYDYTKQRITLEDKGGNNFVGDPNSMSDLDVLYTERAVNPSDGITLKRLSSVLRFVLPLPEGAHAIKQIELSATYISFYEKIKLTFNNTGRVWVVGIGDEVNVIRLDVDGDAGTSARTITAYMLTPGDIVMPQGTELTVSAIAEDGATYSYTFSSYFATSYYVIESGKTYSFEPASPLAFESYRLSVDGTANNYIISGEGKRYAFDATVRGNGVTIDSDFPSGFPTTIDHGYYSTSVLWSMGGDHPAETNSVVDNVYYDVSTGLINFTGATSTKGGNAVIVLKEGADVLWSWHIWMITSPKADEAYDTGGYYDGTVTMMPYNLGAVNTANTGVAGNAYEDGLLYQWGRKDPFLGAKGYRNTEPDNTDYYAATPFAYSGNSPTTPENAYKHPTTFYNGYDENEYDWSDTQYDNLWGNGSGAYADWDDLNNKKVATKTLFDPCPPGYQVAPRNTWSAKFEDTGSWGTYGRTFQYNGTATTFYSASGIRFSTDGDLAVVGRSGYYWSSSPGDSSNRYGGILYLTEWSTVPEHLYDRASGQPVRCARIP
jgi:hypothetical protein